MAKRYKKPEKKENKKEKKSPSNIEQNNEKKGKHEQKEIHEPKDIPRKKEVKKQNIKQKTKTKTEMERELEEREKRKREVEKRKKLEEKKKVQEKQKKIKEREKRIETKQREKQKDNFEHESDIAIRMIMRNNRDKKEQEKQNKIDKQIKKKKRIIIIIIIVVSAIIFALTSPIFSIKNIKVINNKQVSKENVISLSKLSTEQNIFKFLKINVEKQVKQNQYIESIEIKRILPNEIEIKVNERIKTFAVEFLGKYALINNQGYILEISEDGQEHPIIKGIKTKEEEISEGKRLNEEDLNTLETVIKIINVSKDNNLDSKITYIDISNQNEYIIYMQEENKTIYLGDKTNLSNKMVYIQAMINENPKIEGEIFINGDLNNKFKPYFRQKV